MTLKSLQSNLGLSNELLLFLEEIYKNQGLDAALNSAFEKLLSGHSVTESISKEKGKGTILVVEEDDDHDQREILRMVFNKEGYDVLVATNGSEAFNILNQNQISIIVSDIMMPVMNWSRISTKN
jgi:PleD family two-component response regulator